MKILAFQARRFWWKAYSRTLDHVEESGVEDEHADAVVAFLHIEASDTEDRSKILRKTAKHLKWVANKRELSNMVLHSFTHLGGDNADSQFAQALIQELDERLTANEYAVKTTPFGHFCEWGIDVYGESMAKVWKEI